MSSSELDSPPPSPPSDDEETDNVPCGYDFHFIDDLRDEHQCPVCLHAIKNAVQTKCGHRFCEDCLLNTFRRADREGVQWCCPQDRTPLPTYLGYYPDEAWNRTILSLKIECNQKEKGCGWTGELRDYENHESTCKYVSVSCGACKEVMERQCLNRHKESECVERITDCQYCDEQFPFHALKVHQDKECLLFPVPCPQKCTKKEIPRKEIVTHIKKDCPWTMVRCKYESCGCSFQEYRCKMKEHYAQDSPHLFKACKELQKLKQTVSGYGFLQQRVATLEVEKQAMERSLNKSRQEVQELRAAERDKSYMLTQLKTQLAELDRGKTKIQFLEQRVKEMEDRFQAVGYALGFGDGKEQRKKANGSKRKAEVKTLPYSPRKKMSKVQDSFRSLYSEDEDPYM